MEIPDLGLSVAEHERSRRPIGIPGNLTIVFGHRLIARSLQTFVDLGYEGPVEGSSSRLLGEAFRDE